MSIDDNRLHVGRVGRFLFVNYNCEMSKHRFGVKLSKQLVPTNSYMVRWFGISFYIYRLCVHLFFVYPTGQNAF